MEDVTSSNFSDQPRAATHHGEGNIYLRDFDNDGDLDIFHSTRDFASDLHGAHIAINDGNGSFNSMFFPKNQKLMNTIITNISLRAYQ